MKLRNKCGAMLALALGLQSPMAFAPLAAGSESSLVDQSVSSEPLAIVVNQSNPVENLTFSELRKVFLSDRSYWTNGRRITVVMREPGELERKVILHDVCSID